MQIRLFAGLILATLTLTPPLTAQDNDCNLTDHILEVQAAEIHCLAIDDLKNIGVTTFETSTIWTDGVHQFSGVLLVDLLGHLDAEGSEIEATAINDYVVTIPVSDAVEGGPIVAFEMNGSEMSRRDKGPLWVVYPFDTSAKYRTETIYSRSIWQLNRLKISE